MHNPEKELKPVLQSLWEKKKISNQEIMDLMKTDAWGLQTIRKLLIDDKSIVDDNLLGVKLIDRKWYEKLWFRKAEISFEPRYDVFVSYAHKNTDFIHKVHFQLLKYEKNNCLEPITYFVDSHELDRGEWEPKIFHALDNADCMFIGISPEYFQSAFCQREWDRFILQEKRYREQVYGVYFKNCPELELAEPASDWHKELKARQFFDVRHLKKLTQKEIAHIYNNLRETIDSKKGNLHEIPNNLPGLSFRNIVREKYQSQIHNYLFNPSNVFPAIVLAGESGTGKTAVALKYARSYCKDYAGGCYLFAGNTIGELKDLRYALLNTMNIEITEADMAESDYLEKKFNDVLRQSHRMLWIIDNVKDIKWLKGPEGIRQFLPGLAKVHILITTTDLAGKARERGFEILHFNEFEEDEALRLLASYHPFINEKQRQNTVDMLKKTGRRPLNVMLLGSFLYRNVLNEDSEDIWAMPDAEKNFKGVLKELLVQLPLLEQRILTLAALMPEDAVVIDWLYEFELWINEHRIGYDKVNTDDWLQATEHLQGLGLLTETDEAGIKKMNARLQESITGISGNHLQEQLMKFLEQKVQKAQRRELPALAKFFIRTIPNQALFNKGAFADLIDLLCDYGFYTRALECCNVLLSNVQMFDAIIIWHGYISKSYVLYKAELDKEALDIVDWAIRWADKRIKGASPYLANSYYQKSLVLYNLERYEEALKWINESITIEEQINSGGNTDLLSNSCQQKSMVLYKLERYEEALQFIEDSIRIQEQNHPEKDTDLFSNSYHQKSMLLDRLERYDEALLYIEEGIKIMEQNHPEKDTDSLASSYHQKSMVLERLERYEEALQFIADSIRIQERNHPEKNTESFANRYHQKSIVLNSLERHDEALQCIEESIRIKEQNHPERDTFSLTISYIVKAEMLFQQEQLSEALAVLNPAITFMTERFPNHSELKNMLALREDIEKQQNDE